MQECKSARDLGFSVPVKFIFAARSAVVFGLPSESRYGVGVKAARTNCAWQALPPKPRDCDTRCPVRLPDKPSFIQGACTNIQRSISTNVHVQMDDVGLPFLWHLRRRQRRLLLLLPLALLPLPLFLQLLFWQVELNHNALCMLNTDAFWLEF